MGEEAPDGQNMTTALLGMQNELSQIRREVSMLRAELEAERNKNTTLEAELKLLRSQQTVSQTIYDKRHKKPKIILENPPIKTQNRYSILSSQLNSDTMDTGECDENFTNEDLTTLAKNLPPQKTTDQTTESQPISNTKVPPIVLEHKNKWTQLAQTLINQKINCPNAKNIEHGIKIFPSTPEDYRKITKILDDPKNKYQYYSFETEEEKKLKIVIRGLPIDIELTEIEDDLIQKGYHPQKIVRMTRGPNKTPMPLVLAILQREDRKIYDETKICYLSVKIESLRNSASLGQCYRCQLYGHSQSKCTFTYACVKCAGNHPSWECPVARQEPAKCALCQGAHPANYRGCPSYPKPKPTLKMQTPQNPWIKNKSPQIQTNTQTLNLQNLFSNQQELEKFKDTFFNMFLNLMTQQTTSKIANPNDALKQSTNFNA